MTYFEVIAGLFVLLIGTLITAYLLIFPPDFTPVQTNSAPPPAVDYDKKISDTLDKFKREWEDKNSVEPNSSF